MVGARAQSSPMKPGLWETQASSTSQMQMPPEVEAKIAAMPAAQQAQMRSMMGGMGGGGTPVSTTRQVCIAPQTTVDSMLNRAQQSQGMSCTVSNKTQTATGVSFDINCTGQTGSGKGHTDVRLVDDDHVSSTSHMTVTASSQGHTMNTTVDVTTTAKFVSADCGDVKPFTPPTAAK
jgi:hypothetical protein